MSTSGICFSAAVTWLQGPLPQRLVAPCVPAPLFAVSSRCQDQPRTSVSTTPLCRGRISHIRWYRPRERALPARWPQALALPARRALHLHFHRYRARRPCSQRLCRRLPRVCHRRAYRSGRAAGRPKHLRHSRHRRKRCPRRSPRRGVRPVSGTSALILTRHRLSQPRRPFSHLL